MRAVGLLLLCLGLAAAGEQQCSGAPALAASSNYSAVFAPSRTSGGVFDDLLTRSASNRDFSVVHGASRAWVKMPGWHNTKLSYMMQPNKGANFVMYLADMGPGSTVAGKSPITERFMLVLEGSIEIDVNDREVLVGANEYAYLPPSSEEYMSQSATAKDGAKMLVFERIFGKAEGMPIFRKGAIADAPAKESGPAGAGTSVARALLPDSDEWDLEVAVVDVRPGFPAAALRAHYNNHGAVLLAGEGLYRLGDSWFPVQAGDAVWAAPYVPQWFGAMGAEPARLVVYRDRNIDPLFVV
ncbi:(S)-ureidoglycine aminohydrolase [Raphidocelis subcapitata]|uniref:(S)-ureidoglycine aminohydrolase n=1 Tax=Raphidocelis subcapitata TaxID=307507 RepID=A0A2V0PG12_9CHLO|nr:(S)-ureidoglycine aminohydrolase [Raphidocelis subcapitata]|eukprot:GBF96850.1 (S)-ureidoglycine aminohydrolase [Raphidocelis subcapitata]